MNMQMHVNEFMYALSLYMHMIIHTAIYTFNVTNYTM